MKVPTTEQEKVALDTLLYGTGYMCNGVHIPVQDVILIEAEEDVYD